MPHPPLARAAQFEYLFSHLGALHFAVASTFFAGLAAFVLHLIAIRPSLIVTAVLGKGGTVNVIVSASGSGSSNH